MADATLKINISVSSKQGTDAIVEIGNALKALREQALAATSGITNLEEAQKKAEITQEKLANAIIENTNALKASATAVNGVATSLDKLGSSATGTTSDIKKPGEAASKSSSSLKQLRDTLKALADAGNGPAKQALLALNRSVRQFGVNSDKTAQSVAAAQALIKKFNKAAQLSGKGDTSLLGSNIAKERASLNEIIRGIRQVRDTANATIGSGNLVAPFKNEIRGAYAAISDLIQKLRDQRAILQQLRQEQSQGADRKSEIAAQTRLVDRLNNELKREAIAFENLTRTQVAAASAEKDRAKAIADADAALKKLTADTEAAKAKNEQYIRQQQQLADQNRRNAYSFTIMGAQAKFMANTVNSNIKDVISTFGDFDWNLRRAALSLDISTESGSKGFAKLGNAVQDLAIQTKVFDPSKIAEGIYYWGSTTGQTVDKANALTHQITTLDDVTSQVIPIMKAAAITGTDLETALKGVYGVSQQFNIGVEKTSDVTNALYDATIKTAVEFEDLLNSFKMVGPVAASLRVSFKDMTSLLGAIGDAGIRGTSAGRAFRQFFIRLSKDSAETTKMLDARVRQLNKSGQTTAKTWDQMVFPAGQFVGMQGALDALTLATRGLDEAQQKQLLSSASTAAEYPVLLELVKKNTEYLDQYGVGIIDSYKKQKGLGENTNALNDAWKTMGGSVKALIGELTNSMQPALNAVGKALIEILTPLIKNASEFAKFVGTMMELHPELAKAAASVALLTGGLLTLLSTTLLTVGALKLFTGTVLREIAIGLIGAEGAARVAGNEISLLGAVTENLGARFSGLPALLAAPFNVLKDAAKGAPQFFKNISPAITSFIDNLKSGFTKIGSIDAILLRLTTAGQALVGFIQTSLGPILLGIVIAIAAVGAVFGAVRVNISKFGRIFSGLAQIFGSIISIIFKVGSAIFMFGDWLGSTFLGPVMGAVLDVLGTFVDFFAWLLKGIDDLLGKKIEVKPLALNERDAWWSDKNIYDSGLAAGVALSEGLKAGVEMNADGIEMLVSSLGTDSITGIINALKNGKESIRTVALETVQAYIGVWKESFDKDNPMPIMLRRAVAAAESMVSSDLPRVNKMGQLMQAALAEGIKSGNFDKLNAALQFGVEQAETLIANSNPSIKQQGYAMMASLAQGFLDSAAPGSAAALQLTALIGQLNSGLPSLQQAGADGLSAYLSPWKNLGRRFIDLPGLPRNIGNIYQSEFQKLLDSLKVTKPKDKTTKSTGTEKTALEKALETARAGADLAEALRKVEGLNLKALVQKTMGGVASAVNLAMKITLPYAKKFSKSTLEQLGNFGDAAGKVVSAISAAIDAFKKLEGYKRPSNSVITNVINDIVYTVRKLIEKSKSVKGSLLGSVSVFADSAEKIVSLIGSAFDSFTKLGAGYRSPAREIFTRISNDIVAATKAMITASKNIKQGTVTAAGEFAKSASDVVTSIGTAFDTFSKLRDYVAPLPRVIDSIIESTIYAVKGMFASMRTLSLSDKQIETLKNFSDLASSVADAIGSTYDAYVKQLDFVGQFRSTIDYNQVFGWIETGLRKMAQIANSIDPGSIDRAAKAADTAKSIADAIESFFSLGVSTGGNVALFSDQIIQAIDVVLEGIRQFNSGVTSVGSSFVDQLILGMQGRESALQQEVANLTGILSGVGTTTVGTNQTLTITHVIQDPNGALKNASSAEVAAILSGEEFISNLLSSLKTQ